MAENSKPNAIFYIALIERALQLIEQETSDLSDPFGKAECAIAIEESREALSMLNHEFRVQRARLKQAAA